MNPTEERNISGNVKREVARDEMGEFERQFRGQKNSSRLREGLTFEEVFEKAGMEKLKWSNIPLEIRSGINSARERGALGLTAHPSENRLWQMIFGDKTKNIYYTIEVSERGIAWSRFWMDGETLYNEPLNHDSSLSEVISLVAFHEFGEPNRPKTRVAEETREKAQKSLRPEGQK